MHHWCLVAYICDIVCLSVCETRSIGFWYLGFPEDWSSKHPDDIDDESQEEDAVAASDTLSELSAPASSSNLVTPQCKGDQRLKNIKLQMADWDSLQTPVKQRENHVKSLAEELKKAMDEAKGNSVKESALVPGQLPDHVT